MTDELELDLRVALREEAYRPPVLLTGQTLQTRLEADAGRQSRRPWHVVLAGTAAFAILVAVISFTPLGGHPTPSAPCAESPATRHGSWWFEMGGPHAFFNIEPGTRRSTTEGTWLLAVRFDPDADVGSLSISADELLSGEHVEGRLNSPIDPENLFHFNEPAPSLPGGWYLFELDIASPGCWELTGLVDGRVAGSAVVSVGRGEADPTDRRGSGNPPTPAVAGVGFNVIGTAADCPSPGGCDYFVELDGVGRHDRIKLATSLPTDVAPEASITTYDLEPDTRVAPLAPGTYAVILSSVGYYDTIVGGEPGREQGLATCRTDFVVDPNLDAGVVIEAAFSASDCSASTFFVVLTDQPRYDLSCGPIEAQRCRELAEGAVRAALLRYPTAHVVSITFTSALGDYELALDNGTVIALTIN